MMEHLNMQSMDKVAANVAKIRELFPNCVTERINKEGQLEHAIDFDMLKQELSDHVVDGLQERYQFTWPDKRKAILAANAPINKTLRPCREESVDFDNTENLYIEGDNLEVLKLLQETYLGKVKMIYIDPPYNTGNDFVYHDEFKKNASEYKGNSGQYDNDGNQMVTNTESNGRFHTNWLNMIYPRLKLAKDLLSEDGVIFISIDDNEVENLRKVCDEIFGEGNFVAAFVWEKKKKPSFLNINIGNKLEYIICYAKFRMSLGALSVEKTEVGKKYPINNAGNTMADLTFPERSVKFNMNDGIIKKQDMSSGNIKTILLNDFNIKNGYNEEAFTLRGEWRYSQSTLDRIIKEGDSIIISQIPFRPNHVKAGGKIKKMHNLLTTALYNTIGANEDATSEITAVMEKNVFEYAKPSSLVKFLIKSNTYTGKNALIIDFFSGSATTAHAVMQLNAEDGGKRKFIMVELPEVCAENSEAYKAGYKNVCEIGKERIRRAGKKIKEENPLTTQDLDIGFRVLKCDSSNMEDVYFTPKEYMDKQQSLFVDNIKKDRNDEDLLFDAMLKLDTPLSSKIEKRSIAGKIVYNVAQGHLMACFDKDVTDEVITAIAKEMPSYFVMRDSSLANDSVAINFEQIFNTYSPQTVRRVL